MKELSIGAVNFGIEEGVTLGKIKTKFQNIFQIAGREVRWKVNNEIVIYELSIFIFN